MGQGRTSGQAYTMQLGTSGSKPLSHRSAEEPHHRQVSPVEKRLRTAWLPLLALK